MLDIAYLVETKIERKYFLLTLLLKKYLLRPLFWESFLLQLGFWSVIPDTAKLKLLLLRSNLCFDDKMKNL